MSEPRYSEENHPGRRRGDSQEYCPQCRTSVQPGHMDSHMYHAHGVDRRKSTEETTPPPPEKVERRKPTPKDDGGGDRKPKQRGWFAGRPGQ